MSQPLKVYYAGTPNGLKALWTCEEVKDNVKSEYIKIDLGKEEQKEPWYLKINPNGRIPAIVDPNSEDRAVFESGALMMYIAEKYGGSNLLPQEEGPKFETIQWLMFNMGGVGPMFGQAFHFLMNKEVVPYGQKRYINEAKRLIYVLEMGLEGKEYLAAGRKTIADIANACWLGGAPSIGIDMTQYPNTLDVNAILGNVGMAASLVGRTGRRCSQAWFRRMISGDAAKTALELIGYTDRMKAFETDEALQAKAKEV